MEFEFGNQYLIYGAILLCLIFILFYMFYKLYLKINYHADKLDKLDKLLAELFIDKEPDINNTPKESKTKESKTKESKKQPKNIPEEKKEILDIDIDVDNYNYIDNKNPDIKEDTHND
jgi:hypothetical protein